MATPPIEELQSGELKEKLAAYAARHDGATLEPHETMFLVGICRETRDGTLAYELILRDHQSRPERFGLSNDIEAILGVVRELFGCRSNTTVAIVDTLSKSPAHAVTLVVHGQRLRSFMAISLEDIR